MTHPFTSQKKNLKMILVFLMIASCPWIALGGRNSRTQRQHIEKNSVNSVSKTESGSFGDDTDWLKISAGLPNSVIAKAGETLELECEVLGSPPPNVKWLKDGKIFYPQGQEEIGNDVAQGLFGGNVEEDSNNLPDEADVLRRLTGGLAKVVSRLKISCVTPKHQGVYTCLATLPSSSQISNRLDDQDNAFLQTALSSTILQVRGRRTEIRSTACSRGGRMGAEGAWIQEWLPVIMQTMGKGVVLSCRAGGHPRPTVSWLDSTGKPVSIADSIDAKHRVLPTGELFINELHWEDMDAYTCLVQNSMGKSSATTFLYPFRSEDQS